MKQDFWFESWKQRGSKTSFHRPDVHPYVQKYATPEFLKGKRVLVPLAGKTNALDWFRQYADYTIGVELVKEPIIEFFDEHNLAYSNKGDGCFEAENMTFFNRDLFELTVEDIGQVDFVYDRASLIAFPYDMRVAYLQKMDELCPKGSKTLLITLEYEPYMDTPPFSITPAEVETYYAEKYDIDHIEQPDRADHRMKQKLNLKFLIEHGYMLTKKSD